MKKQHMRLRKRTWLMAALFLCISVCTFRTEAAQRNQWVKKSGKCFYMDAKGNKAVGLKKIRGKYYFFDKQGVLYKNGWKTIKGKKYYFSKKNGAASTGPVKIGKKKYLFTKKGRLCGTGIQKYGKKYYYTKKGVIQTGLKTVKGKTYYFKAKGPAKKGWFTYKGKRYYFGANGAAVTGIRKIGGRTYQFSKKGILQKEITTAQEPETSEKPLRPVEPEIQDPSVVVPTVEPVEDTEWNRVTGRLKIENAIDRIEDYLSRWSEEDFEPNGYKVLQKVLQEAKAMAEAAEKAYGKKVYPYTATELYQEAAKLEAYREQCLVMQKEQVLTYYPEQSKAIFNAINEYRKSKGVEPLVWSENASKASRLEAGYAAFIYKGTDEQEDLTNFEMHHMSQLGCVKVAGLMGVEEIMEAWIKSPVWHEPWLRDPEGFYGSVAYYTYNSATTGVTWSKVVFTSWPRDDVELYTHAPETYWDTLLNCETSSKVFP